MGLLACLMGLHDWVDSYPNTYEYCRNCDARRTHILNNNTGERKKLTNMWGKYVEK